MEGNIPNHDEIALSRQTIVRVLTATTVFLLLASIAGQFMKYFLGYSHAYGFIRLFYVDIEGNIPTFFSSTLLLLASLMLALITVFKRSSKDPYHQHWALLSLILLYMAIDEAASIHEMLNKVGWWVTGRRVGGIFHYGWVMFGMVVVGVVALSYLKFFFTLPARTRVQFFTAAAVFVSGALGVEILEGFYSASHGGEGSFQFSLFVTVEEGLEMAGIIVLINALLIYLIEHYDARLRLDHFTRRS